MTHAVGRGSLYDARLPRAEHLARALESEIETRGLAAGDRLGTKDAVRLRYGISPATVSEAVKLLAARGVLEARTGPGGGLFVAAAGDRVYRSMTTMGLDWSTVSYDDSAEVRDLLEPTVYAHASVHCQQSDIEALLGFTAQMAAHLDDPGAYAQDNHDFHQYVATLTPNAPLRAMYSMLADWCRNGFDNGVPAAPGSLPQVEAHRALALAIADGPGPHLTRAIARHAALRQQHRCVASVR